MNLRTLRFYPVRPGLAGLCLFTLLSGVAYAANITGAANPAFNFGNLNQHDTACNNVACGPTSAINSFVYLENSRPDLYGDDLVPHTIGNTFYQDEIAAADNLNTWMNGCVCSGTFIEDFITGKVNYINNFAPNTTVFEAQISIMWLQTRGGNSQPNTTEAKPAWVMDQTTPTAQFIANQLNAGQDVELFVANAQGAHYLTVTGIDFDPATSTGTLSFIDPDDGLAHTANITGLDAGSGNAIQTDYQIGAQGGTDIFAAVAESPVPEPGALLMFGMGISLILIWRRRPALAGLRL